MSNPDVYRLVGLVIIFITKCINSLFFVCMVQVADCICLMSLNHLQALPVDTHVYQIAAQNYLPHLRGKKTVTDKMYTEIGDHFRTLYGDLAGWAHTVSFMLKGPLKYYVSRFFFQVLTHPFTIHISKSKQNPQL